MLRLQQKQISISMSIIVLLNVETVPFHCLVVAMRDPGVMSDTKSYLFCIICQPTLLYGLDAVDLNNNMIKKLENAQGGIMKRVCGIPKRSYHTQLLQALNISSVNNMLINQSPHCILECLKLIPLYVTYVCTINYIYGFW